MKIDIKQIASYLPYKLKGQIFEYKIDYIKERFEELTGIEKWEEKNSYWGVTLKSNSRITLSSFKPILRPMSDLTKEIEVNGIKFVPMKELLRIALKNIEKSNELNPSYDCNTVCWSAVIKTKKAHLSLSFDSTDNSFIFICDGQTMAVPNQLELFEKLYEWLFDIYALIEKGLAIDVNTLYKPKPILTDRVGDYEGEICNRDVGEICKGVIEVHDKESGCSCHIIAPCSSCERNYEYCPSCGWEPEQP